jgi:hypothetical protein
MPIVCNAEYNTAPLTVQYRGVKNAINIYAFKIAFFSPFDVLYAIKTAAVCNTNTYTFINPLVVICIVFCLVSLLMFRNITVNRQQFFYFSHLILMCEKLS